MACFLPVDLPTPLSWYYTNNQRPKLILMKMQPRDNNLWDGLKLSWKIVLVSSGNFMAALHVSSSETQGQIVGTRESLNGRKNILYFSSFHIYFFARLDFPSLPLSAPGSPRMYTYQKIRSAAQKRCIPTPLP